MPPKTSEKIDENIRKLPLMQCGLCCIRGSFVLKQWCYRMSLSQPENAPSPI